MSRGSLHGRPFPSSRTRGVGRSGPTTFHCASVRSILQFHHLTLTLLKIMSHSDHLRELAFMRCALVWAAAVVVPCFFLARRLAGRDAALRLSRCGLLIPSVILMSPTFDQVFATMSATILVFLLEGLERRSFLFGALAGGAGAVALFFSY